MHAREVVGSDTSHRVKGRRRCVCGRCITACSSGNKRGTFTRLCTTATSIKKKLQCSMRPAGEPVKRGPGSRQWRELTIPRGDAEDAAAQPPALHPARSNSARCNCSVPLLTGAKGSRSEYGGRRRMRDDRGSSGARPTYPHGGHG